MAICFYKDKTRGIGAATTLQMVKNMSEIFENDIGPVEQVFCTMFNVLDQGAKDMVLAELHMKNNRQTSAIMRCLDEIEAYLVDPYRFGSVSLIGKLHGVLLEVVQ